MIANFHGGHARSHFPYNPRALMAKDRRKNPLAILALQRVSVGMADACRHDFYQNLARLAPIQIDFMDFKRLVGRDSNGCTSLHGGTPCFWRTLSTKGGRRSEARRVGKEWGSTG